MRMQLTSLTVLRNFSRLLLVLSLFNSGCALFDRQPDRSSAPKKAAIQKAFLVPYDRVWTAALKALKYQLVVNNSETGVIESDFIKGDAFWKLPDQGDKPISAGLRYKIVLVLTKGKIDGKPSTRVTIEKKMEVLRDFFSDAETLESDQLEEKTILYRIERELLIEDAIRKAGA